MTTLRRQITIALEDEMLMIDSGWDGEDDARPMKLTYTGFDVSEMPRKTRHPVPTRQIFDFGMNLGAHTEVSA